MMQAAQGSEVRADAFAKSLPYQHMMRKRAAVAREALFQLVLDGTDNNWHFVCAKRNCRQAIARLTDGATGHVYTISELLTLALAHYTQCHEAIILQDYYGEDYA